MNKIIIATNKNLLNGLFESLQKSLPEYDIQVVTSNKDFENINFTKINPSWIFFPFWSNIISKDVFENYRCVIFHMTDLPFGRGGSPLQNLIARGFSETKISAIKCSEQIDGGDIYMKSSMALSGSADSIYNESFNIIFKMIEVIVKTNPVPLPQSGKETFFKRRTAEMSNLDGLDSVDKVYDWIRMLDAEGYPHAYLRIGGINYEFTGAKHLGDCIRAEVRITKIG